MGSSTPRSCPPVGGDWEFSDSKALYMADQESRAEVRRELEIIAEPPGLLLAVLKAAEARPADDEAAAVAWAEVRKFLKTDGGIAKAVTIWLVPSPPPPPVKGNPAPPPAPPPGPAVIPFPREHREIREHRICFKIAYFSKNRPEARKSSETKVFGGGTRIFSDPEHFWVF